MTQSTIEENVLLTTARSIASLREQARNSSDKSLDKAIGALESAAMTLSLTVRPNPAIITELVCANCPDTLANLLDTHGVDHFALPGPGSPEMRTMDTHVTRTPDVEAAIELAKRGGIISFGRRNGALVEAICQHDCPRRLRLLVALGYQRPAYDDEISEVFALAGPRVGAELAEMTTDGRIEFEEILGQRCLEDLTVKEFAWLLAAGVSLDDYFLWADIERILPTPAIALARKTQSSHGRIELRAMEPSLTSVCGAPENIDFFRLTSQTTHLLKDAQ